MRRGKHHSKEARRRISEANKGKHFSIEEKKRLREYPLPRS